MNIAKLHATEQNDLSRRVACHASQKNPKHIRSSLQCLIGLGSGGEGRVVPRGVERAIHGRGSESLANGGGTVSAGHEHGGGGPGGHLGLGLNVDGHGVRAGHIHDLLNGNGLVLDHIHVLNDLSGHVHVTHDLDLNGGVNVLDDIDGVVDDLGLVDGVGTVNIDYLNLGHVSDLFDLNNLGDVLDDLHGGINIGGNRDVTDLLAGLSDDLGDMTNDLKFSSLGHNLGHVSDDLLDLGNLNVFDGHGHMDCDGGLDVLDLGNRYGDLTDLGHGLHDGDLNALFNDLGDMDRSVHDDLTGNVADLRNFNLNRARDLAVLDDLNSDVLVDDLVLRDLNNSLDRDGTSDLLGDLDLLHHGLDLDLGNLDDALNRALDVLNLWDLHNSLLSDNLGNVDDTFLGDDLRLDHLHGGGNLGNGGMHDTGHEHGVSELHGLGSSGLVVKSCCEHFFIKYKEVS